MKWDEGRAASSVSYRRVAALKSLYVVAGCRDDRDEGVQLMVIKAIEVALLSPHVARLSEGALLLGVRAVYHICLKSASPVNKLAAKASLQKIVGDLFARMERLDATTPSGPTRSGMS